MDMNPQLKLKDVAQLLAVGQPDECGWNKLVVYQKTTRTFTVIRNFIADEWCIDFEVIEHEEGFNTLYNMIVGSERTMLFVDGWEEVDSRYGDIDADVLEDWED